MEPLFHAEEINYLISFIGETALFGIASIHDESKALNELIKQGLLEKDGKPNNKTVFVVEMLRAFKRAAIYLHVQNFVFALSDDKNCIINKKTYEDDISFDQFFVGDYKVLWNIILRHPIISKQFYNRDDKISNCNLIIELFDNSTQLLGEMKIEIKENGWYELDDDLKVKASMKELEIMQWIMELLPNEIAKSLKGEMINEQRIQ